MKPLLERLREGMGGLAGYEAADEIERLRAVLKNVADNNYQELSPEDYARAALEQSAPKPDTGRYMTPEEIAADKTKIGRS